MHIYKDNMNFLENIQNLGSAAIPITLNLGSSQISILSNEFVITLINYANQFTASFGNITTLSGIYKLYASLSAYVENYLI